MAYTINMTQHKSPQSAAAALSNTIATRQQALQYLSDVNDSAHYPAKVLIELVCETFALTPDEARAIYREWNMDGEA